MVETIVGGTFKVLLQNLIAFSTEEICLIWNFSKDLQSLKDSVAMIRDLLEDAKMKQVNDKPVQRWLIDMWLSMPITSSISSTINSFARKCREVVDLLLKELEIDNMESCLPLANICGSKLTTLTKLIICNVDGLVRLPEGLFNNNRGLSELEIRTCHNMLYLVSCLRGGGSSLKKLVINNCLNFNEFPEDLHTLNSLEDLTIHNCPNLKSIPYPSGIHLSSQGFTSLRDLNFFECSTR